MPDRALVAVETPHGRLYALRMGRSGLYVGGPASWCGEADERPWTWDLSPDHRDALLVALSVDHRDALLVALSVPAGAPADHLRQLAADFEQAHKPGGDL